VNQRHLLHARREFEQFYNGHRPHLGIANARPPYPLPAPTADPDKMAHLDIRRRDRLDGIIPARYRCSTEPYPSDFRSR
jgi:hypothetical protein